MSDTGTFWLEKLRAGRIVLIDGGTGTELQRRGVAMSRAAWSALAAETHRDVLREIHADYIRAGAEVITTNTFGSARFVLEAAGAGARFRSINVAAVETAVEARDASAAGPVAIAGALSCLPPGFHPAAYPGRRAERDAYRELAGLLAETGADLLVLEMMEELEHAPLAMEAALVTGLPVWLGVSCRVDEATGAVVGYDFPRIPLVRTLDALLGYRPTVVSVMHTPPEAMPAALAELRSRWAGPMGAYPELGDFMAPDWRFSERLSPTELAGQARTWIGAGAQILGGCCGTTPDHIRALKDHLPISIG